jgi:hypothetical protein
MIRGKTPQGGRPAIRAGIKRVSDEFSKRNETEVMRGRGGFPSKHAPPRLLLGVHFDRGESASSDT